MSDDDKDDKDDNEKKNDKDKLSRILNITPTQLSRKLNIPGADEEYVDIEQAKFNIKDIIMKGSSSLDDLIDVARQSEHPRAYEVLANLIRTLVDSNKILVDINIREKSTNVNNDNRKINNNNNIFVGSTKDLLQAINPQQKTIEHDDDESEE